MVYGGYANGGATAGLFQSAMRAIRYGEMAIVVAMLRLVKFQSAMRAIRYGGGCKRTIQKHFWIVSIRYACN